MSDDIREIEAFDFSAGVVTQPPVKKTLPPQEITEEPVETRVISTAEIDGEPPIDAGVRYYFYPTWRSQLFPLIGFFVLCIISVWASNEVSWLTVRGRLFSVGNTEYWLDLPILTLLPAVLLGRILLYMYDAKYIIDDGGVEAQIGLVSLHLRQPRLRWEDIRGVEPNQTLWERILGIGSVLVGSAMTNDVEIVMEGVANPRAIQLLIGTERDRRLRLSSVIQE